ncbi:MAG TPA: hypothetical protein VJT49_14595 [Amycolatopsis sp.]|uniref:hypothetical protein n=1 Tax=Amycolatopsis sp. TaxID=37632 RepID=UPI002B467698|nr:hypothetical protein [Amycolatopsis sp.]HKS46308.1 hypothetical protein [Amycolatopsis sp.]
MPGKRSASLAAGNACVRSNSAGDTTTSPGRGKRGTPCGSAIDAESTVDATRTTVISAPPLKSVPVSFSIVLSVWPLARGCRQKARSVRAFDAQRGFARSRRTGDGHRLA